MSLLATVSCVEGIIAGQNCAIAYSMRAMSSLRRIALETWRFVDQMLVLGRWKTGLGGPFLPELGVLWRCGVLSSGSYEVSTG